MGIEELSSLDPEPSVPAPDTALSAGASCSIENIRDDQGIPLGTGVHHHLELGVERFLHGKFTYFNRKYHRDQKNNIQIMGDAQSCVRFLAVVTSVIIGTSRSATATATPSRFHLGFPGQ